MVIPLRSVEQFPGVKLPARLTPIFCLDGKDFLLETPKMSAVPKSILKSPVVTLSDEQTRITQALGFLFEGY